MGRWKARVARMLARRAPRWWLELRIRRHDKYFEPEFWLVPDLVKPGSAVVDVGANQGHYTYFMAKSAGAVHAFEPNPICQAQLARIIPGNVTVHPVALSDHAGQGTLRYDPGNTGLGTLAATNPLESNPDVKVLETVDTPVCRLDDLKLAGVSFMKVDVEGYEEQVLGGAHALLGEQRPAVLIEIEERHNPGGFDRVRALMKSFGYSCFYLVGDRLVRGDTVDIHTIQDVSVLAGGLEAARAYINNFLFLPGDAALPRPLRA